MKWYINKYKIFVFFICFTFFNLSIFSQESINPIVKIPFQIEFLCWSEDDSTFAFCEKDSIFLRDSESLELLYSFPFPNIMGLSFFYEVSENDSLSLMAINERGILNYWTISNQDEVSKNGTNKKVFVEKINTSVSSNICNIAFTNDSNYIAIAKKDNSIDLFFKLKYTKQLIPKKLVGHKNNIFYMTFSPNSKYLASLDDEKKLKIWSTNSSDLLRELNINTKLKATATFSSDSNYIIYCSDKDEISKVNILGEDSLSIKTRNNVRKIYTNLENEIVVLTDKNNLDFYDFDGIYKGYIPSFNLSKITAVAFSHNHEFVLVGHEDGSVYKIEIKKSMLDPDELPPKIRMIRSDEVVVKGDSHSDTILSSGNGGDGGTGELSVDGGEGGSGVKDIFTKRNHGLDLRIGVSILPDPYSVSADLVLGYINNVVLYPFYFGGNVKAGIGFPRKSFPYEYSIQEKIIPEPVIVSSCLNVPFGIKFLPFNNDIELYAEISVGGGIHFLWNMKMDDLFFIGKIYPAFVGSISIGAGWKGLSLRLNGDYDSFMGFMFSANIGYILKLPLAGGIK